LQAFKLEEDLFNEGEGPYEEDTEKLKKRADALYQKIAKEFGYRPL
jgi:hypothetical protein